MEFNNIDECFYCWVIKQRLTYFLRTGDYQGISVIVVGIQNNLIYFAILSGFPRLDHPRRRVTFAVIRITRCSSIYSLTARASFKVIALIERTKKKITVLMSSILRCSLLLHWRTLSNVTCMCTHNYKTAMFIIKLCILYNLSSLVCGFLTRHIIQLSACMASQLR